MSDIAINLFVYGTLMPGETNFSQIEDLVISKTSGTIDGVLVDCGAYPALIPGEGIVKGILLKVSHEAIAITDQIEGCMSDRKRSLYLREEITVRTGDNHLITAWTYLYAKPESLANHPRLIIGELNCKPLYAWLCQKMNPKKKAKNVMSYCMMQRSQDFQINANLKAHALAAIKAMVTNRANSADATHEHRCFADTIPQLVSLEEALKAWGWQLVEDTNGESWLEYMGNKLGDDRLLFDAIAPFVQAGSFIEMSGEDGTIWRWYFDGKRCEKVIGQIVFNQPARVLITIRGGAADYVTDGHVSVAMIDYDNEPDAMIPEEFRDLDVE